MFVGPTELFLSSLRWLSICVLSLFWRPTCFFLLCLILVRLFHLYMMCWVSIRGLPYKKALTIINPEKEVTITNKKPLKRTKSIYKNTQKTTTTGILQPPGDHMTYLGQRSKTVFFQVQAPPAAASAVAGSMRSAGTSWRRRGRTKIPGKNPGKP